MQTPCESMALYVFSDQRPLKGFSGLMDWQLCGFLSRLIYQNRLKGEWGEKILIPGAPRLPIERIFILGAGPSTEFNRERFERLIDETWSVLEKAHACEALLSLPNCDTLSVIDLCASFVRHIVRHGFLERVVLALDPPARKLMQAQYEQFHREQLGERYSA